MPSGSSRLTAILLASAFSSSPALATRSYEPIGYSQLVSPSFRVAERCRARLEFSSIENAPIEIENVGMPGIKAKTALIIEETGKEDIREYASFHIADPSAWK